MKKTFTRIFIIIFLLCAFPLAVFAQNLTSRELLEQAAQYDGRSITYSGEVIGEIMRRGEFYWVNISDGENALGVWVNSGQAKEISFTGSYKTRGDSLEVIGIFHRACAEHGGDLDIHAQSVRKVSAGRVVKEKLNSDKVNLSLVLLGALFLVWILMLLKRK